MNVDLERVAKCRADLEVRRVWQACRLRALRYGEPRRSEAKAGRPRLRSLVGFWRATARLAEALAKAAALHLILQRWYGHPS
jgi:hypothetical protein